MGELQRPRFFNARRSAPTLLTIRENIMQRSFLMAITKENVGIERENGMQRVKIPGKLRETQSVKQLSLYVCKEHNANDFEVNLSFSRLKHVGYRR